MINGIINLKKDSGMTSHDAVFKLRKILKEKKIGHGGTLDPDVTGVLPIAVGKATRVIEYMTDSGKVYEGEVTLGFSTTTEDSSGELVAEKKVSPDLLASEIDKKMREFIGDLTQVPPMYSAVKVNGKKLYEYARAGEEVERPVRHIKIFEFERTGDICFTDNGLCRFPFRVACSKGTYVRTLAVELGRALSYPSHMSYLVRTASAGLILSEALTLAEITEKVAKNDYSFLLPMAYGVSDLPHVNVSQEEYQEIQFGRRIHLEEQVAHLLAAFIDGRLAAILEKRDNTYKPKKVFLD